jgi:uncharacterized membrane protein
MNSTDKKINKLIAKLQKIEKQQSRFSKDIEAIKAEINKLQEYTGVDVDSFSLPKQDIVDNRFQQNKNQVADISFEPKKTEQKKQSAKDKTKTFSLRADIEKFIGESLISKLGIIIILIGIAIGIRYSIEKGIITPVIRVMLGYIAGLGLLAVGWKLKKKYAAYSAVLVSGAAAIMYFTTFFAYDFYELIPHIIAFAIMLIFITFTVYAAFNYNMQIIAHIGLVGAYAVPFLLSKNSDNVAALFIYMSIINLGVLAIAFKKYWKPLYYLSAGVSWMIFALWYLVEHNKNFNLSLALIFLLVFFITAYLTFIIYKFRWNKQYKVADVLLLLTNSFIFYGLGYAIFNNSSVLSNYLGVFTLFNAVIHSAVGFIIYSRKLADKNLFYLIVGLVIIFITITVPVQFTGNWVTLLWVGEGALLFWIGRTKAVSFYEKISYPPMIFAFLSIVQDWSVYVKNGLSSDMPVIFNFNFLSSLLFVSAFAFIIYFRRNKKYASHVVFKSESAKLLPYLPVVFLAISVYYMFRLEISLYFGRLFQNSLVLTSDSDIYNKCYVWYKDVWIINYSMLFLSVFTFLNSKYFKSRQTGKILLGFIAAAIVFFLLQSLNSLSELRDYYLQQAMSQYYTTGVFSIIVRYVSYVFAALALITLINIIKQKYISEKIKVLTELFLYISVLWIVSSEFINILELSGCQESNKLGLSILWGVYSLGLIILGIWKNKKHLRLAAFILFGITLIKLLFYDLSRLSTGAKTAVFVLLGVIMLIISFLYNKYNHIIDD